MFDVDMWCENKVWHYKVETRCGCGKRDGSGSNKEWWCRQRVGLKGRVGKC